MRRPNGLVLEARRPTSRPIPHRLARHALGRELEARGRTVLTARWLGDQPPTGSRSAPIRDVDKLVGDLLDASSAADQIVARGRDAWHGDRLLRLAGEAVISRIGDAASKLPDDVRAAMPGIAWEDYAILWDTLARSRARARTPLASCD